MVLAQQWRRQRRRLLAAVVVVMGTLCAVGAVSVSSASSATSARRKVPSKAKVRSSSATRPSTVAPTTLLPVLAKGPVTVFAASSLTAAFTEMASAFEKANPDASVVLNFAGSSTLVSQVQNGAPADAVATADSASMAKLGSAKLIDGTPVAFTRNRLMIVVPKGNPLRVKDLTDLGRPEVFVALGAPGVPAGDYAREILARAGIEVKPKTLEQSVAAIVNKAALKEIDAGVVYATDVATDEYRVDGVAIPIGQNIVASYPIAVATNSKNRSGAQSFLEFVLSPAGQSIMAKYKFLPLS